MQTHDDSNHNLRKQWLESLRNKADRMMERGTSSITAGELNEEPICKWKHGGVHCSKMPDDEHGVLRISIGGGANLPIALTYCVVRGDVGECIDLLEKAIAALRKCPE